MKSNQFLVVLACAAVFLGGCTASNADNGFGAEEFDVGLRAAGYGGTKDPPAGPNGKKPACFWDHGTQEALRGLGAKGLDSSGLGNLPALPMVQAGCHEIIEAAVECALDQTKKIYDVDTNVTYVGWWGLAKDWDTKPLSTEEGDLVTACVLQRLNAFGVTVQVLLEGEDRNNMIKEDLAADVDFPFHESTVFGNMFTSKNPLYTNRPAFDAYICAEADFAQSCRKTARDLLDTRICDSTSYCGFNYVGDCASPGFLGASCPPIQPGFPPSPSPYWWCNVPGQSLGAGVRVQLRYNPHPPATCY